MGGCGSKEEKTVLLCVTGCIAAYKSCEVLRLLQKAGCRVKVLMTEHATQFVGPTTFRALTHEKVAIGLFDDPEDPIHHISLAQEADIVLVAPATANIIAKMSHGIADDLMSTTLLATKAPVLVAPAMNSGMWSAAATQENIRVLSNRGVHFVQPDAGYLACGDDRPCSLYRKQVERKNGPCPRESGSRSRSKGDAYLRPHRSSHPRRN